MRHSASVVIFSRSAPLYLPSSFRMIPAVAAVLPDITVAGIDGGPGLDGLLDEPGFVVAQQ